MNIKILETCCSSGLKEITEKVVKEMGIAASVENITDLNTVMAHGIMKAPAVVVNEKVKSMGRIPTKNEIQKFIQDEINA